MNITVYDFNRITGSTHKIIGIEEVVQDALDKGVNTISVISSGNYRDAILAEIRRRHAEGQVRLVNLVNEHQDMPELELETHRVILRNPSERERYVAENRLGAGKVRDYTDFIPTALEREAEKMLQSSPDYVALGLGSGKLFVTLYRRIKEKRLKTRLIGVLPRNENPIFNEGNFKSRSLADKLTAPYSSFKDEVLQAQSEGHVLYEATDNELKRANRTARSQGFKSEISGSAGFVLNDEQVMAKCGVGYDSNVIFVNTGCGEQRIIRMPLYRKALRPVLAAAASVLLCLGASQTFRECQVYRSNREALISFAKSTAEKLGDAPDFRRMSNSELNEYLHSCKTRMGGPPHYFL